VKKSWGKMFTLLMIVALAATLTACGSSGKLEIGTDNSFKPFCYLDENGKVVGFDVDLWDAIAKEAGIEYELKPMEFKGIINSVKAGTLDAAIAGITIKDERKEQVDFAMPYYNAGLMVLVAADNNDIQSVGDLKGKVVATKTATTSYDYAMELEGVKEVKPFEDIAQAYQELMNGRADAVIFDAPNVADFANSDGKGKVKTVADIQTGEQYGIALTKGSKHMNDINKALQTVIDNGTYAELYEKWFGVKPSALPGQ
jgi:glutamine transport system substrate-binding protein